MDEDAVDFAAQVRVAGQQVAYAVGETECELTDRHVGQHMVDQAPPPPSPRLRPERYSWAEVVMLTGSLKVTPSRARSPHNSTADTLRRFGLWMTPGRRYHGWGWSWESSGISA